ncbi:MAG: glycosyltransferase family 4 protein [Chloroflexi bacterium]|nr:glycosyltransferase family 4 protein [Chloroflexota bacterium]
MRIAQVAPPFESVPPSAYGGTERVIASLTDALVKRGHDVTLFASGDSHTTARLEPTVDEALWHAEPALKDHNPFWSMTLDAIWDHLLEFDVIHSHIDYWGYPLARHLEVPIVTTLHGRLDLPELNPLYRRFADVPLVSISNAQRQPVPWANFVATVYHGIELDQLTFNAQPGRYLAFLGRISPEKGLDTAIRVAKASGLPLRVAARKPLRNNADPNVRADWEHYHNDVQPLVDRKHVQLIGEVAAAAKDHFLRNAAALLFPIRWPEPFGLVMVEALACGTPVIALREGSVPEVIEDGVTGFICANEDEMVAAVGRLGEIDRGRCRAEAERRFSPDGMARGYEAVYDALLRHEGQAERQRVVLTRGWVRRSSRRQRGTALALAPGCNRGCMLD